MDDRQPLRVREEDLNPKQSADRHDQSDDQSLEITESAILEEQQKKNIPSGEQNAKD
jgi:hypothetical protein